MKTFTQSVRMLTFTQFGVILFTQYCVIVFYAVLCNFLAVAFDHNSHRYKEWQSIYFFNLDCGELLLDKLPAGDV